jgi:hypothetical protein
MVALWVCGGIGVFGGLAGLGACDIGAAPPVDQSADPVRSAPEIGGTWARLEIRAAHRWGDADAPAGGDVELRALFVAHRGVDRITAARQVGVARRPAPLAAGRCRRFGVPRSANRDRSSLAGDESSIDLLDAGALYWVLPGHSHLLRPTPYPDVLPHVAGLYYRKTIEQPPAGLSTDRVSVLGLGGAEVSTFELLRRPGPREVRLQRVAGRVPAAAPLTLSATEPATVRWGPAQSELQVRVQLGVGPLPAARPPVVECRPRRDGALTVASRWLARLRAAAERGPAWLRVAVSRQERLELPGLGRTVLRITQSDAVPVYLEP